MIAIYHSSYWLFCVKNISKRIGIIRHVNHFLAHETDVVLLMWFYVGITWIMSCPLLIHSCHIFIKKIFCGIINVTAIFTQYFVRNCLVISGHLRVVDWDANKCIGTWFTLIFCLVISKSNSSMLVGESLIAP